MSSITEHELSGQNPKVIVCLESADLWDRLGRCLGALPSGEGTEFVLVRSQESSPQILEICRRFTPALLAVRDSRMDAIPFKELRNSLARRDVQILIFSEKTDDSTYERFFNEGCAGLVPVDVDDQTLRKAIEAIFDGELWIPRRILSRLALAAIPNLAARKLTPRETEIYKLISSGLTNQQVANRLSISRETVRWHVRSLHSKFRTDQIGPIRSRRTLPDRSLRFAVRADTTSDSCQQ